MRALGTQNLRRRGARPAMTWSIGGAALARILADVVAGVLRATRPDASRSPRDILYAAELWPGGMEMDSLERLDAASAVDPMFDVRAPGLEVLLLARRTVARRLVSGVYMLARSLGLSNVDTPPPMGARAAC